MGIFCHMTHIPYSFWSQDTEVAQATFYEIAGLKSLANHQLRSYHTHKVWCGSADKGLIECGKVHDVRGHSEASQNTLEYSIGGVLS